MKTFFSKIEAFFKKVFGSTNWERTASATLTVIAPLLTTVITLTAGEPAAAAVSAVITDVQNDLAAASALIGAADSNPTLTGIFSAITTNLNGLLSAAEIKNPTTQEQVNSVVGTVLGEIEAIVSVIPVAKAA